MKQLVNKADQSQSGWKQVQVLGLHGSDSDFTYQSQNALGYCPQHHRQSLLNYELYFCL